MQIELHYKSRWIRFHMYMKEKPPPFVKDAKISMYYIRFHWIHVYANRMSFFNIKEQMNKTTRFCVVKKIRLLTWPKFLPKILLALMWKAWSGGIEWNGGCLYCLPTAINCSNSMAYSMRNGLFGRSVKLLCMCAFNHDIKKPKQQQPKTTTTKQTNKSLIKIWWVEKEGNES